MTALRDAADVLSIGAELLTEFADWIEEGGPRTFGEWLLNVECPEDERPPIVTPPPVVEEARPAGTVRATKKDHYDPFFYANQVTILLCQHLQMRDVDYMRDVVGDAWKYRCRRCGDVLKVERMYNVGGPRFLSEVVPQTYIDKVAVWYREHGPNCGRVTIERAEWIEPYGMPTINCGRTKGCHGPAGHNGTCWDGTGWL